MTSQEAKIVSLASILVLRTPAWWSENIGPIVLDPDGWRFAIGGLPARSLDDPITLDEFRLRARHSTTCLRRPRPA